jgi:hypothetical protein
MLGYVPEAHAHTRGWNSFLLRSEEDYNALLRKDWTWGPSGLFLKTWTVNFDPIQELVVVMRVSAILPSLPWDYGQGRH